MKRKKSNCSSATRRKIAGGVALATTLAGSAATTTSQAWPGLEKIKGGFANTTNYLKSWFGYSKNENDVALEKSSSNTSEVKQETSRIWKAFSALLSKFPRFPKNKDSAPINAGKNESLQIKESKNLDISDSSEESGFLHKKLNDVKGGIKGAYDTTKNKLGQWVERSAEVAKNHRKITANVVGATAISSLIAAGSLPASVAFKILTVAVPIVTDFAAGKKISSNDRLINGGMLAASAVLAPYAFSVYPSSGSIFEKIGFGLVSMCGSAALGYVFRPKNIADAGLHLATGTAKAAWNAGKALVGFNEGERLLSDEEIKNTIYDEGLDILNKFVKSSNTEGNRLVVENFVAKEKKDLYEIYSKALKAVEEEDKELDAKTGNSSDNANSGDTATLLTSESKGTSSKTSKKDRVIKKMKDICKVKLDEYINNIQEGETKEEENKIN